jgi:cell division protein FtsZ
VAASDPAGTAKEPVDGFIAPSPAEPETSPAPATEVGIGRTGDPAAEPTRPTQDRLAGEARQPLRSGRRRSQSLFARVSDAARAFQGATQIGKPVEPVKETIERRRSADPTESEQTAAAQETNAPRQPTLVGLDPAERIGAGSAEEDLLDIPAFLRRQAN